MSLSYSNTVTPTTSGGSSLDGGAQIGVEDFLLSQPETGANKPRPKQSLPTRRETIEATFSPLALLPSLLSRDPDFASTLGAQPKTDGHILDLVDEHAAEILNEQSVSLSLPLSSTDDNAAASSGAGCITLTRLSLRNCVENFPSSKEDRLLTDRPVSCSHFFAI